MKFFDKNIQFLRKQKGLKQVDMQAQLGYNRTTWNNYERGVSEPDLEGFFKIAKFFGVSVDHLYFYDLESVHLNYNDAPHIIPGKVPLNVPATVLPFVEKKQYKDKEKETLASEDDAEKDYKKKLVFTTNYDKEFASIKHQMANYDKKLSDLEQRLIKILKAERKSNS